MSEQSPTLFDTSKLPDSADTRPVLFLDQTFSSAKLAAILEASKDWRIELHSKYFPSDEKDHNWIPVVAARGWLILSCDKRIKSWRADDGVNRRAAVESAAKMFFMGRGGRPLADYAYDIGSARVAILRMAKKNRGPFFAKIHRHGHVEMFFLEKRKQTSRDKTRARDGNVV
jgi:hypothetical protein